MKYRRSVGEALGSEVTEVAPVRGGDINEAWSVTLADGRRVFVKTNRTANPKMFQAEARGLEWLGKADCIRVPKVLDVGRRYLVLEVIRGGLKSGADEALGRQLAALHQSGAPGFGLDHDNFIGRLPQNNGAREDWPTFYREQRLEPQVAQAWSQLPGELARDFERLYAVLDERCGPGEPPARLHGDLWGGNWMVDAEARPVLIDPAVYGGHREMDLAMMQLFGGFSGRCFAAYDEAFPLEPGWRRRVPLYQLYPLLVHVNLFGAGYLGQVAGALKQVL